MRLMISRCDGRPEIDGYTATATNQQPCSFASAATADYMTTCSTLGGERFNSLLAGQIESVDFGHGVGKGIDHRVDARVIDPICTRRSLTGWFGAPGRAAAGGKFRRAGEDRAAANGTGLHARRGEGDVRAHPTNCRW